MSEFHIDPKTLDAHSVHTPFFLEENGKSIMFFAVSENYSRYRKHHLRHYSIYIKKQDEDQERIIHHGTSSCGPWVTKLSNNTYRMFVANLKCENCGFTIVSFKSDDLKIWKFEQTVLESDKTEITCPCIVETKNGTKMYYTETQVWSNRTFNQTMVCDIINDDTITVSNHQKVILNGNEDSKDISFQGYLKPNVFVRDDHLVMLVSGMNKNNMYTSEFYRSDDGITWDLSPYNLSHLNRDFTVNQFYKGFIHQDRLYYVDKLLDTTSSIASIPFDINCI